MGMFDNIHYNGEIYQTKDFDCQMARYFIEDGKLLKAIGHHEDKSPATAWGKANPGKELPPELSGLSGMCGCMAFVQTGKELEGYTGEVEFYGDSGEFTANFKDGILISITPEEQPS